MYQPHPYANIFPMMSEAEKANLIRSMQEDGYDSTMPIVLHEGLILDGRNRYEAAQAAGVEPVFTTYEGNNALSFVIRHNLHRRHLNETQRAVVATKIANMPVGGDVKSEQSANLRNDFISQPQAAQLMNTSVRTMQTIKAIEREAPELIPLMESGEMTANEASKEIKKQKREEDLQKQKKDIEEGIVVEPSGLYSVISIDPPWPYGREYDPDGSRVANPYPEMSIEDIKNIKLPLEKDSVIFLWTTHAFLPSAFEILNTWGAQYKATLVWNKQKLGMGHWFRMQCEFCLVGIIGKPYWNNKKWPDIIEEKRREHSRKPDVFFDIVDEITAGKKLEYFSREKRQNWDNYGNEPEKF